MSRLIIGGGNKLSGTVRVEGAKNAILPILAGTILNEGISIIHDCPDLRDVGVMIEILRSIGCKVKKEGSTVTVDSSALNTHEIPEELVREMRSSIVIMGAMIARFRKTKISYPGGCEIGLRPIDIHIKGLKQLGIEIIESHGFIYADAPALKGAEIHFDIPSVGATQNVMFAAVLGEGTTIIRNAAKEPEIIDLQKFLNAMGAKIRGAGTNVIRIEGVKALKDVEHTIIPDRIVAGTYLAAGAITGGNIELQNVEMEHIQSIIAKLRECGCSFSINRNAIKLTSPPSLRHVDTIITQPYPGFPTDMQAQFMAVLTLASGTSVISETIFENRFKHSEELMKMGADIRIDGRVAVIRGVKKLTGASVTAKDLRGGAALVLAGLAAEGETVVDEVKHIDRGYQMLEDKLNQLGANIRRVDE